VILRDFGGHAVALPVGETREPRTAVPFAMRINRLVLLSELGSLAFLELGDIFITTHGKSARTVTLASHETRPHPKGRRLDFEPVSVEPPETVVLRLSNRGHFHIEVFPELWSVEEKVP
jgi:hypothetical protein